MVKRSVFIMIDFFVVVESGGVLVLEIVEDGVGREGKVVHGLGIYTWALKVTNLAYQ